MYQAVRLVRNPGQQFFAAHAECGIVGAGVDAAWFAVDATTQVASCRTLLDHSQLSTFDHFKYRFFFASTRIRFQLGKTMHVDVAVGAIARA